jgi:hypothetical protein
MRFIVMSDEGERLGSVAFGADGVDADELPYEPVATRIEERYRELRADGGYDDSERLVRATLERVSADTGFRFVRDASE